MTGLQPTAMLLSLLRTKVPFADGKQHQPPLLVELPTPHKLQDGSGHCGCNRVSSGKPNQVGSTRRRYLWRLLCLPGAVLPGSTTITPPIGPFTGADLAGGTAAWLKAGAASDRCRRRAVAGVAEGPSTDIGAGLCAYSLAEAQQGKSHQEQLHG